jgi:hypothetical protein
MTRAELAAKHRAMARALQELRRFRPEVGLRDALMTVRLFVGGPVAARCE